MYTQYVQRFRQNLQQRRTKIKIQNEPTIVQSNSVTMQLDYTAIIIPNDRFEKPVDRDDDVTQEESYVVVCVCVCVWKKCVCVGESTQ